MADLDYIASNILLGPRTDWSGRRWWLASKSSSDPNKEFEVGVAGGAEAGLVFDSYAASCAAPCDVVSQMTSPVLWDEARRSYSDLAETQQFTLRTVLYLRPGDYGTILKGSDGLQGNQAQFWLFKAPSGGIGFICGATNDNSGGLLTGKAVLGYPITEEGQYEVIITGRSGEDGQGVVMYVNCERAAAAGVNGLEGNAYDMAPTSGITYLPGVDQLALMRSRHPPWDLWYHNARFTGAVLSAPEVYVDQHYVTAETAMNQAPTGVFWRESVDFDGGVELWWRGIIGAQANPNSSNWRAYHKVGSPLQDKADADDTLTGQGSSWENPLVDTGLDDAQAQYYRIATSYTGFAAEGPLSEAMAKAWPSKTGRPRNLMAIPSSEAVILHWSGHPSASEYRIYRHTAPFTSTGDATLVASISHSALKHGWDRQGIHDDGVTAGTDYYYRMTMVVSGSESELSRYARVFDFGAEVEPDQAVTPVTPRASAVTGLAGLATWDQCGTDYEDLQQATAFSFRAIPFSVGAYLFEAGASAKGTVVKADDAWWLGDGNAQPPRSDRAVIGVGRGGGGYPVGERAVIEGSVDVSKGAAIYVNGVLRHRRTVEVDMAAGNNRGGICPIHDGGIVAWLENFNWSGVPQVAVPPGVVLYSGVTPEASGLAFGGEDYPAPTPGMNVAAGTAELWWDDAPGNADEYRIYRATSYFGPVSDATLLDTVTSVPTEASPYLDSTIVAGTTYFYRITAVYGSDEGEPSQIVQLTYQGTGVTDGMTQDATWSDPATDYADLADATAASFAIEVRLDPDAEGYIMEAGATGAGLALYVHAGRLYFQCGDGENTDGDGDPALIAECSYDIQWPTLGLVEWSADTGGAALYVDGQLVDTDTMSNSKIAGGNPGGILPDADDGDSTPNTRLGINSLSDPYTLGVQSDGRVYVGETTTDVQNL
ncbi:MAG: hypothetical protein GVY18_00645 [Bacteroidetes bacterium]|jgi:hypothetical protein|nr:hypothetical protein [Bacteroidota bacterium]